MRKYAYLARLEELLDALPPQERQDALNYYEEYFDAAGNENEEHTAEELGDPADVARKILEGEGIDPLTETGESGRQPALSAAAAESAPESEPTSPEEKVAKAAATPPAGAPISQPAAPELPALEDPEHYPSTGTGKEKKTGGHGTRRIWVIFWLLVALALVVQISVLLLGLGRNGGSSAFTTMEVAESQTVSGTAGETAAVESAGNLEAVGPVTYSGGLDVPGKGTLFVNLTRGNVAFRTGDQATVEVRNVEASSEVSYSQTVDFGYAFVCDSTDPDTHVTITLPEKAYDRLEVHISNSGAIDLGDLAIRQIDAFTASGPVQSGCLRTEDLNIVTDIGNVWLEKVSDGTGYTTRDVSIQAPHGYVSASFSAPRNEWEVEISAPEGLTESTASGSEKSSEDRSLEVVAASKVNLKYGVK